MVYDSVISTRDRKNPEREVKVYWCMNCEVIIRLNEQLVHDKVISVRATIFKNKQSKILNS